MHLYPYLLASSDACLVTLQASAGTYCVPSKLWSIYCAKKPSIVSVDAANMAAKITERIDAGIVIPTGSSKACITAIKQLMTHPGHSIRMGNNARRYAEGHFTINGIADEFESIIQNITVNDRRFRRRITGP
jgi:glycosyltransferase involved in cell wall biosynthesis